MITFGNKDLTVRVENLKETTRKDEAENMFTIVGESYHEDQEKGSL